MPLELRGGVGEEFEAAAAERESLGEERRETVVDDGLVAEAKAVIVFLSDRDTEEMLRSTVVPEDGV